jgi:acyl carrier protein
MDTRDALMDYLCRDVLHNHRVALPSLDQPLLGSDGGPVDSVGLYELIDFIESRWEIKIDDLEILPENFSTLNALIAFIDHKRATKSERNSVSELVPEPESVPYASTSTDRATNQ